MINEYSSKSSTCRIIRNKPILSSFEMENEIMKGNEENIKTLKIGGAVGEIRGENRWIGGRKRFDQFKGGL